MRMRHKISVPIRHSKQYLHPILTERKPLPPGASLTQYLASVHSIHPRMVVARHQLVTGLGRESLDIRTVIIDSVHVAKPTKPPLTIIPSASQHQLIHYRQWLSKPPRPKPMPSLSHSCREDILKAKKKQKRSAISPCLEPVMNAVARKTFLLIPKCIASCCDSQ